MAVCLILASLFLNLCAVLLLILPRIFFQAVTFSLEDGLELVTLSLVILEPILFPQLLRFGFSNLLQPGCELMELLVSLFFRKLICCQGLLLGLALVSDYCSTALILLAILLAQLQLLWQGMKRLVHQGLIAKLLSAADCM
jgi:hypothetical protein